ncbi:MAG: thiamine pyrophosphate-dependent dehydrogenase E1 component subunit alpha [Deinococcus sp.]|nr:thiamine pyrophosphate-dependent dehydrogenase E1 component subunit alpha [Deinococcus sp.]
MQEYRPEFLAQLYSRMYTIRRFEERASELRNQGHIPGFLHPYIGQEAVAAGVCAALEPGDYLTSTHRGHGHLIARGADLGRMMAELFARTGGYCQGKGGSLHIANIDLGVIGANGIVAGGIPIAVGAALAIQQRQSRQVAVSFFGDGASNEGAFHEALNLAALWKLPVLFVCENNHYGEFTPQEKHQPVKDIAVRASSYNMPGIVVDGNDVLAVHRATAQAAAQARAGRGPTLVECKTYRHRGHYEGDAAKYRPQQEVEQWLARDPLQLFRRRLLESGEFTAAQLVELEAGVEAELERGVAFAHSSPHPQPDDALDDAYSETHQGRVLR